MGKLVAVQSFLSRYEAELARGALESSGIPCMISADDCGGMRPHLSMGLSGVRLLVNEADAAKAADILENS